MGGVVQDPEARTYGTFRCIQIARNSELLIELKYS